MIFKEKQKFTQWYIWIIPMAALLFMIALCFQQIVLGKIVGQHPGSNSELLLITLVPLSILMLLYSITLITEVSDEGIYFNLKPFTKRFIRWEEIQNIEIIRYDFVGYGLRVDTQYGTVYNIKGYHGIKINLKDGKRILIGTQKADDFNSVLNQLNVVPVNRFESLPS